MLSKVILAACLMAVAAGVALAESDKPPAGSVSVDQVTSNLQSQGYNVTNIKFDDGRYKVKATDASGRKAKLAVNPQTGDVMSKEDDNGSD